MHRRRETVSSVQAGAPLERDLVFIPEFCKMASQQLELRRVVDADARRVRSVGSRAFQATIGCRESARKNVPASRETRASPNSGTTLDVLCSEDKAALPLR